MPALAHTYSGTGSWTGHGPTRRERAEALLRMPGRRLMEVATVGGLWEALEPFTRPFSMESGAFETVAFVHGFGVAGPGMKEWVRLFGCAEGLRAEEIGVLVAFVATGGREVVEGCAKVGGLERERWGRLFGDVALGEGVPGVVDKVCDMFEEWVLSMEGLRVLLEEAGERGADGWWLEKVGDGYYYWRKDGVGVVGEMVEECRLGDGVRICAGRIGVAETRKIVGNVLNRVSGEGVGRALQRLGGCVEQLAEIARQAAEGVLVCRVFECLGIEL